MRISDWSSDVCSSDLTPTKKCRSTKPVACCSASRRIFSNRRRQREQRTGHVDFAGVRSSTNSGRHISWRPLMNFQRRSEEHTSELQSLMRISYAVFCLKKKHNRRTRHESTVDTTHKDLKYTV